MTFGVAVYIPHPRWANPITDVFHHIVGGGIELMERYPGSHIAPVVIEDGSTDGVLDGFGGDTWDAELGGLKRRCLANVIREYCEDGSQVWVYRFAKPLTPEQKLAGLAYCQSVEGLPYDCLDFVRLFVIDVAEWMGIMAPLVPGIGPIVGLVKQIAKVDISKWLGLRAVICFRVGKDFLAALGFPGMDGPRALDQMLAAGTFKDTLLATNETGGPVQ